MKLVLTGSALILAASCARPAFEPKLSADHPANPAASSAKLPAQSETLALDGRSTPPAPAPATAPATLAAGYVCPMHADVTSNDPNARCPKCGMKLRPAAELEGGR